MKKIIQLFLLIFTSVCMYAQINSPCSIALREAKVFFDEQNYGKALKFAEDAILLRKEQIKYEANILEKSLASKEVKKAGEKIDSILPVLTERGEFDCISIINSYTDKKGINFFNNSIYELLDFIKQEEEYPEAQKLLGDIYKLEGEYEFAEEYYKKALSFEKNLDIPDEKYEILYLLADISRLNGDYDKMEIRLLNIIGNTQLEKNKIISRAIKNNVKENKRENVNKIFQLYRTYDYYSMNAYGLLADYYYSLNELDKAFSYSSLAVLNGFSKICSILEKRNMDYSFTTLESFFDEVPHYSDIVEWGKENNVWKSFNVFCDVCLSCGYDKFAMELIQILAFHSPEKYWQQEAVLKLDKLDGIKNPD